MGKAPSSRATSRTFSVEEAGAIITMRQRCSRVVAAAYVWMAAFSLPMVAVLALVMPRFGGTWAMLAFAFVMEAGMAWAMVRYLRSLKTIRVDLKRRALVVEQGWPRAVRHPAVALGAVADVDAKESVYIRRGRPIRIFHLVFTMKAGPALFIGDAAAADRAILDRPLARIRAALA